MGETAPTEEMAPPLTMLLLPCSAGKHPCSSVIQTSLTILDSVQQKQILAASVSEQHAQLLRMHRTSSEEEGGHNGSQIPRVLRRHGAADPGRARLSGGQAPSRRPVQRHLRCTRG